MQANATAGTRYDHSDPAPETCSWLFLKTHLPTIQVFLY